MNPLLLVKQIYQELIEELGIIPVAFIHAVAALVVFLIVDCSAGHATHEVAIVTDKHYIPEASWYTTEWRQVRAGRVKKNGKYRNRYKWRQELVYHHRMASYKIFLATWDGNTSMEVSSGRYRQIRMGQQLPVRIWNGHWSKIKYWTTIR